MTDDIPHTALQRRFPDVSRDHYIPRDLWFIRARLLKEGVLAPGPTTSSAHSSRSDLGEFRRRVSLRGGVVGSDDKEKDRDRERDREREREKSIGGGTAASSLSSTAAIAAAAHVSYGVWVFIDIQLYQLEAGTYMVDFKCDGYQNVVRIDTHSSSSGGGSEGTGGAGGGWKPISRRIRNKEKEATSPYPFLDVASDLVAQLAVAN